MVDDSHPDSHPLWRDLPRPLTPAEQRRWDVAVAVGSEYYKTVAAPLVLTPDDEARIKALLGESEEED